MLDSAVVHDGTVGPNDETPAALPCVCHRDGASSRLGPAPPRRLRQPLRGIDAEPDERESRSELVVAECGASRRRPNDRLGEPFASTTPAAPPNEQPPGESVLRLDAKLVDEAPHGRDAPKERHRAV